MARWQDLYDRFSTIDRSRREERDRAAATERELARWCDCTMDDVMTRIHAAALERAREFEEHTGRVVVVAYPSHPPFGDANGGPSMRFMSFLLDGAVLHLYSHRVPGSLPVLQFALGGDARQPHGKRSGNDLLRSRLLSVPACVVERLPDDGYALLRAATRKAAEPEAVSLDDLVFRAFDLVVEALHALDATGG